MTYSDGSVYEGPFLYGKKSGANGTITYINGDKYVGQWSNDYPNGKGKYYFKTRERFEGNFVNGELTLGENIGDLGGMSVAYEAYRLSLDGAEPPVIDGLTGDQRFFLGWAQICRRLYRERELLDRLITDPHSPSEYRANGVVRNMDAWYDAFDVGPDAPQFLKPEDRVRIW